MESPRAAISWQTATIVNINAMIGAGIYSTPLALIATAGPAGMITFAAALLAVWMLARSLATVASRVAGEGSFYTYAASWGGRYVGSIAIAAYLGGLVVAMGLLVQIVGPYIAELVQLLTGFTGICGTSWGLIAFLAIAITTAAEHGLPAWGQRMLIIATLAPLATITILCFKHATLANLTPFAPEGLWPLFTALKIVIFGFFGFECAASLASRLRDPRRDVARAVTLSVAIVGTIYALFIGSIMLAVPRATILGATTITQALLAQFPHHVWLMAAVSGAIVSAILGTLHSMLWSSSTLVTTLRSGATRPLSHATATCIVSAGILAMRFLLRKQDLFWSLTSLGIVTAYMLALGNLFWAPQPASKYDRLIGCGGLVAGTIITLCAIEGLIQALA